MDVDRGAARASALPRSAAENADDSTVALIAPDGPVAPFRPSGCWTPGRTTAVLLFGLRAQLPARERPLRDLLAEGEAAAAPRGFEARPRGTAPFAHGCAALAAVGLLVLLLRGPSSGPSDSAGPPSEASTELVLECTKVACVGASITKGSVTVLGGELASNAPYPTQLQALLGPSYCVENFGQPGATVLKHSREPFWAQPQFEQVRRFLPDVVVIQFGANDSREKNYDADFRKDYTSMITFFRKLPSRPQVYIMAMPPIYPGTATKDGIPGKKYGMDKTRLDNLAVPLILIAKENGLLPPINVLNSFKKHCPSMAASCDWMSGDGVHPNHLGDAAMAKLVHFTIRGDDHCSSLSEQKELCGDPYNITEASCKDMGCCYTPDSDGKRWCFKKHRTELARPEECLATHDERTDCGFEGESMEQCKARGCCYRPSLDGNPWCFHRLQPQQAQISPTDGFARQVTSTSWTTPASTRTTVTVTATSTTTATLPTTTRTETSTSSSSTAAGAALPGRSAPSLLSKLQGSAHQWPLWLTALGLAVLLLALSARLCQQLRREDKQQTMQLQAAKNPTHSIEDEERRRRRRLEKDRAMKRTAERQHLEIERKRSERELQVMLSKAGFAGVNEPKSRRNFFRVSFVYPLHAAVEVNNLEAVKSLLQAVADANLVDSRRRTPLALAQQLNRRDSHRLVIALLAPATGHAFSNCP